MGKILVNEELIGSLLTLMKDSREYSLARSASEFFRNLSYSFETVELDDTRIDLESVYRALI